MVAKAFQTDHGTIQYWVSGATADSKPQLVFLPGLTADHRLFNRQLSYFDGKYRLFVWDAPGHADSYPFEMTFSLADKARWLHEILAREGFTEPVIIGQSMGGYLGQMYLQLFPGETRGFISIDSAPLQRSYYAAGELWLLERMEPVYRRYPWRLLLKQGCEGVATTKYGRETMRKIMMTYAGDQRRYARLAGHGYRLLAEAVKADLPYEIDCPALLLCGDKDRAGSTMRYNRAWHRKSGLPLLWIKDAGHNSNTDEPEQVNKLIELFVEEKVVL